jgi:hypothetical protein
VDSFVPETERFCMSECSPSVFGVAGCCEGTSPEVATVSPDVAACGALSVDAGEDSEEPSKAALAPLPSGGTHGLPFLSNRPPSGACKIIGQHTGFCQDCKGDILDGRI